MNQPASYTSTADQGIWPKFFFSLPHTHKCVISLLLVVLLFISQLQQQFFSLTYFLSITVGYSPPGHLLCQAFADDTLLHSSRDRAKLTARMPQCLERNSPGRKSSQLQFSMGKTELLLTTISIIFLENVFPSS